MAKSVVSRSSIRMTPVMVLAGAEMFLRREILEQIRGTFQAENESDFGYVRLDETASVLAILDECRTVGMFAPKKLVVVDPADGLFRPRGGSTSTGASGSGVSANSGDGDDDDGVDDPDLRTPDGGTAPRELILRYAEAPSENSTLVLVCSNWPKTTRLHKFLEAQGAIHGCEALSDHAIPPWLTHRARQTYGKEIRPDAAQRLAELIGSDLAQLDSELQKLALYVGPQPEINLVAVDALVGFQHEHKVWDMIGALADGDIPTALVRHDELWQMDPRIGYTLVGAVFYWLGQVLKAREMLDRRMPERQIIQDLRLYPPPRAAAIIRMARRWGLSGARRCSAALLMSDMASKTSIGEPRRNMECFIAQLANP